MARPHKTNCNIFSKPSSNPRLSCLKISSRLKKFFQVKILLCGADRMIDVLPTFSKFLFASDFR